MCHLSAQSETETKTEKVCERERKRAQAGRNKRPAKKGSPKISEQTLIT